MVLWNTQKDVINYMHNRRSYGCPEFSRVQRGERETQRGYTTEEGKWGNRGGKIYIYIYIMFFTTKDRPKAGLARVIHRW